MGAVLGPTDSGGTIMAKRDGLSRYLRQTGALGVRGVGLTGAGGSEHLLLLVAPGTEGDMPKRFRGVPITVRVVTKAIA